MLFYINCQNIAQAVQRNGKGYNASRIRSYFIRRVGNYKIFAVLNIKTVAVFYFYRPEEHSGVFGYFGCNNFIDAFQIVAAVFK